MPPTTQRLLLVGLVAIASCQTTLSFSPDQSPLTRAFRDSPEPSLLRNTKWKLRLDVGLQPGSWMPKRFPGWGESGARLGFDVEVHFTDMPAPEYEPFLEGETYRLRVCAKTPSSFVSDKGAQRVIFSDGGYCIQRPVANIKSGQGALVKPEGILQFWLDCESGARRRDVEIAPNTRILFTTGVWDDPTDTKLRDLEYRKVLEQIKDKVQRARANKKLDDGASAVDELVNYSQLFQDSLDFDRLKEQKEIFERELPPVGSVTASNGVQIAPVGSLVIKGNGVLPAWMPLPQFGHELLILGKFSTIALENDPSDFERLGSIYFGES